MGVSDLFSLNKASKQPQGSTLEKILLRSNNVIAALKDLVANNQIAEAGLQEMLMRSKNLWLPVLFSAPALPVSLATFCLLTS